MQMEIRADLMDAHMYAFQRFKILPYKDDLTSYFTCNLPLFDRNTLVYAGQLCRRFWIRRKRSIALNMMFFHILLGHSWYAKNVKFALYLIL